MEEVGDLLVYIALCQAHVDMHIGGRERVAQILAHNLAYLQKDKEEGRLLSFPPSFKRERKEQERVRVALKEAEDSVASHKSAFLSMVSEGGGEEEERCIEEALVEGFMSLSNCMERHFSDLDPPPPIAPSMDHRPSNGDIQDLIHIFPQWYRMNMVMMRRDQLEEVIAKRGYKSFPEESNLELTERDLLLVEEAIEDRKTPLCEKGKELRSKDDHSSMKEDFYNLLRECDELRIANGEDDGFAILMKELQQISEKYTKARNSLADFHTSSSQQGSEYVQRAEKVFSVYSCALEEKLEKKLGEVLLPILSFMVERERDSKEAKIQKSTLRIFQLTHSILCKGGDGVCTFLKVDRSAIGASSTNIWAPR